MAGISVIVPARNAAGTVSSAIKSTAKALNSESEIVVIDDCSSDSTAEEVMRIGDSRVRVFRAGEQLGVAKALNWGLEVARHEVVARMDADDITLPGRFSRQARALRRGFDLVFTTVVNFRSSAFTARPAMPVPLSVSAMPLFMLLENVVAHSSLLARRNTLLEAGGYIAGPAEDYLLWLKAISHGASTVRLGLPGVAYRTHSSQVTRQASWNDSVLNDPNIHAAHRTLAKNMGWSGPGDLFDLIGHVGEHDKREVEAVRQFFRQQSVALSMPERLLLSHRLTAVLAGGLEADE